MFPAPYCCQISPFLSFLPIEHVSQQPCLNVINRGLRKGDQPGLGRAALVAHFRFNPLTYSPSLGWAEQSSSSQGVPLQNFNPGHPAPTLLPHSGWDLPLTPLSQIPATLQGRQEGNSWKMTNKSKICPCQRRETQNTAGLVLEEQGGGAASCSIK